MRFKEGDRRLVRHGGWVATMHVVEIPVETIIVGERRRQDFGDIGALAAGIQKVGLLEPIVVDGTPEDGIRLVCGERRLQAVKMLKWETIPAQLRDHLSDEDLREIELEENDNRKSLTERERTRTFTSAKKLVEKAKQAGEVFVATTKTPNPKGGRPPKGEAPRQYMAEALGLTEGTLRNAENHIATAEQFPFMQAGNWRQSDVLRVRERIEELPAEERESAAGVLGCAKLLDPEKAVELVENLTGKKPAERQAIYDLAQSDDPRNQSLALTEAAKLPPMPDPRLGILDNVLYHLNAAIKPYPQDPLTPQLADIRRALQKVRAAVKEVSYDAHRAKGATVQ